MNLTDHWGGCYTGLQDPRCQGHPDSEGVEGRHGWFGNGADRNYHIMERCNYVSNAAYYHAATRICDYPAFSTNENYRKALKQSFVTLSIGSSFWHGSHTNLGVTYDNNMIAVIAYTAHQLSISSFNSSSAILNGLRDDITAMESKELSEQIAYLSLNKNVYAWNEFIQTAPYNNDYFITFGALLSSLAAVTMPGKWANYIIGKIAGLLIPDKPFLMTKYMPELLKEVANKSYLPLPFMTSLALYRILIGVLLKLLWAFTW